jgi:hypothetical protein
MAKVKRSDKLYKQLRDNGVRKRVARELSRLPGVGQAGKKAPKPARQALERLQAAVSELEKHTGRGDRKAAARKAARTRKRNQETRSRAARKAAKTRARS